MSRPVPSPMRSPMPSPMPSRDGDASGSPDPLTRELVRAVDLALAGHWDDAHAIVQTREDDAVAAWIHAVLHKIEGDESNSLWWYRRAGRTDWARREPDAELRAIRDTLAG